MGHAGVYAVFESCAWLVFWKVAGHWLFPKIDLWVHCLTFHVHIETSVPGNPKKIFFVNVKLKDKNFSVSQTGSFETSRKVIMGLKGDKENTGGFPHFR